jgi:uroporphyrinogen decarboxylase
MAASFAIFPAPSLAPLPTTGALTPLAPITRPVVFPGPLQHPEASHRLLSGITDILVDLLVGQWRAGADILLVFETNAEALPPLRFAQFAEPYLLRLAREVRERTAPVESGGPVLSIFAKGASYALPALAGPASLYDVISLDWGTDPAWAVRTVRQAAGLPAEAVPGERLASAPLCRVKALQGNLDPSELFGSPSSIREAAASMLRGFGGHPHIANLGHGMLPGHTPSALGSYFDAVMELSPPQAGH